CTRRRGPTRPPTPIDSMHEPSFRQTSSLILLSCWALACWSVQAHAADDDRYEAAYHAALRPDSGVIEVELNLSGERLPNHIAFSIDPQRHRKFRATDPLQVEDDQVIWKPRGKKSRLRYEFVVDNKRGASGYDSYMTAQWAIFRGDKLVP